MPAGAPSNIAGTLRSTTPGADFYFITPAGILFGPNASLDLPGSFHVSTADEVRFRDGREVQEAVRRALEAMGHSLSDESRTSFGGAQAIMRLLRGWAAASDPRKDGVAIGW